MAVDVKVFGFFSGFDFVGEIGADDFGCGRIEANGFLDPVGFSPLGSVFKTIGIDNEVDQYQFNASWDFDQTVVDFGRVGLRSRAVARRALRRILLQPGPVQRGERGRHRWLHQRDQRAVPGTGLCEPHLLRGRSGGRRQLAES